ncbi:MAG TPA: MFS transporter [Solirubrobacteraceae bacterium]|nr:MFS transporter [Solirubrobacteraceae bacterium]
MTRTRRWAITGALSVTETVSYGILYYAFAAFLVPMQRDLGYSTAELTGAFSAAILVSALAGVGVGRFLDRHSPRGLMTAGSVVGTLLVLAWSRVDGLAVLYAVWVGIGLVMAAVLYEAAFTVLAKHFAAPAERRRAMTAVTLVAALASFIFVPLSQALIDAYGWRDALVILAGILGAITVPLHALVLRPAPEPEAREVVDAPSADAGSVLRSRDFWMLSAAFFLAQVAAVALIVHAIPILLERGHSATFAAFALGLVGLAQIPGRILFGPVAARVSPAWSTALVFAQVTGGIVLVATLSAPWAIVAGFVLLGMGNGMGTLARATVIADRYGQAAYGTIGGVAASLTIAARAAAPVAAAVYAAALGYDALLWTLAALALAAAVFGYRAELEDAPVGAT